MNKKELRSYNIKQMKRFYGKTITSFWVSIQNALDITERSK